MKLKCITMLVVILTAQTFASITYIDFCTEGNTSLPSSYAAAADSAGVWNGVGGAVGTTSNLLDISGEQTSVDLTVSSTYSSMIKINTDHQALNTLLQECVYATNSGYPWTVRLTGLENGEYDVYVYAPANPLIVLWDYSLNGVIHSDLITGSRDVSLDEGVDYEISRVTVSGGSIVISGDSDDYFTGLAGIQIIAIPEPASVIMFLTGGFIVAALRRVK